MPIFVRLLHEDKTSADVFVVKPSDGEYVGLSNENMETSFLVTNELTLRNEPSYWSPRVTNFYIDAHPARAQDQKEGVLLLDAVNPRVTAPKNTRERAKQDKQDFLRFHIIVLSGTGGMLLCFAGENVWLEKEELSKFVLANHDADDGVRAAEAESDAKKFPPPSVSDLLKEL